MKFTHAITRKPADSYLHGITTAELGQPDLVIAPKNSISNIARH